MEIKGRGGISAKIIADSVNTEGDRITSFELVYPRFIHSEFMTHRLFSRNSASSRAIPSKKLRKMVWEDPAMPIHWGKNQSGMQADNVLIGLRASLATGVWKSASKIACLVSWSFDKIGLHKQVANRVLEPFQFMKVVMTTTETDNFFWLRRDKGAQPEIKELADCMHRAVKFNEPVVLYAGEWHLPYVITEREDTEEVSYRTQVYSNGWFGESFHTLEEAKKISASCCAQVSYRVLDHTLDKATKIHDMLVESKPVHASPFEHQATPITSSGQPGVTHFSLGSGDLWSGNLKGWVQYRQLIPENTCWNYESE